jgi:hypothetical protein
MKFPINVTLVEYHGDDASEYDDLLGCRGTLRLLESEINFLPEGRAGDWLSMKRKRMTRRDNRLKISTKLGNTFIFRMESSELTPATSV